MRTPQALVAAFSRSSRASMRLYLASDMTSKEGILSTIILEVYHRDKNHSLALASLEKRASHST